MVSSIHSGSSGLGSRPGQGHCALCLGTILYSYNAFLNRGDGLASHPWMFLVTSCYSRALHATGGLNIHVYKNLNQENYRYIYLYY